MRSEIGSEFWDYSSYRKKKVIDIGNASQKVPDWLNWGYENRLFATGRTALNHIICDIKASNIFKLVYMPSYCCHSMIVPFVSNGIEVVFYDVLVNESGGLDYKIDYSIDFDALIVMNYFGFLSPEIKVIIEHIKNKKEVIIIEDATHSLFCKNAYDTNSDYVFASFRKWFAIPGGGIASKKDADFNVIQHTKRHDEFLKMRLEGMQLKADYMNSYSCEKDIFLQVFKHSEDMIERDYKEYKIDDLSFDIMEQLDVDKLRLKRIANAQILIDGLEQHRDFKPLFSKVTIYECPLFVPIICKNGKRDNLHKHLIKNDIYCPLHWPKSDLHTLNRNSESIYDLELSVICDQRYDSEDMEHIINEINNF
jgi:dTDP-4-amino-4,6-dideoxygalactose transaminase